MDLPWWGDEAGYDREGSGAHHMGVLNFGHTLLWVTVALLAVIALLCVTGISSRDRRFIRSARVGFYVVFVLVLASSGALYNGGYRHLVVQHDFFLGTQLEIVYSAILAS